MAISRSLVVTLALVGCGDGEPEVTSEVTAASIVDGSPFVGPGVPDRTQFAPLAVRGRVVEGAISSTSPFSAHQGRHSDGTDLSAPPRDVTDPVSFVAWVASMTSDPKANQLQPPAVADRLQQLVDDSSTHLGELDSTILEEAADLFSAIPGVGHMVYPPEHTIVAWAPARARWLDSLWAKAPTSKASDPETHFQYPIPAALAAFPDRAARLYCAAREVTHHQTSSGSLGDQVLLPLTILGHTFEIGVFDPVAYVNQPAKVGGSTADGVSGFNIPLLLGVTIWPVRGLLPALPQIRYPLVVSSMDSEVLTDVSKELIYEDQRCITLPFFGSLCLPIIKADYRGRWKTLAHTDSVQWASRELTSSAAFPLFYLGPVEVDFLLNFGAAIGKQTRVAASATPLHRDMVYDDRLMMLGVTPPGWPATIRQTNTSTGLPVPYYDGYWRGSQLVVPGDPSVETFSVHSIDGGADTVATNVGLPAGSPLRAAALADDDRHVAPVSELAMSATVHGIGGVHFGDVEFLFTADGTVGGSLGLAHDIRDSVGATVSGFGTTEPMQSMVVTPTTYGSASFNLLATLDITIPLVIHTIHAHFTLIDKTFGIASFNSPWSEEHRLRIGTEAATGDATIKPNADSHVAAESFASFTQSVPECLADPTAAPAPPLPCTPDPVDTTPFHADTCFATSISPQIDPCLNIPTPSDDLAQECQRLELTYMCSSVSKEQVYGSDFVLAHKIRLDTNATDLGAIAGIADACSRAEGVTADAMDAWFAARFTAVECLPDATLVAPSDVATSTGPSGVTAGHCH